MYYFIIFLKYHEQYWPFFHVQYFVNIQICPDLQKVNFVPWMEVYGKDFILYKMFNIVKCCKLLLIVIDGVTVDGFGCVCSQTEGCPTL